MAAIAVLLSLVVTLVILGASAAIGSQSPIAGDPGLYNVLITAILNGEIPYLEYPLEHLPGAVVPMFAVEGLSRISGVDFETLWPAAMAIAFIATVGMASTFPTEFDAGKRILWYSLPLLPLVLFRIEPWLVLWVVASMMFAFRRSWPAQVAATAVASLIKGWPLLLFALPFQLSKRKLAVVSAAATFAVLIVIALTPGFREGREFSGIHTETVVGSLALVFRSLRGVDAQLIGAAGASYTAVPAAFVGVNALFGVPFLVVAGIQTFRTSDPARLIRTIGLGVLGVLLASPLFSTQFVFWLVPFVIFTRQRARQTFLLVSILTLLSIMVWAPRTLFWDVIVLGRNVLLILLGIVWVRELVGLEPHTKRDLALET